MGSNNTKKGRNKVTGEAKKVAAAATKANKMVCIVNGGTGHKTWVRERDL